MDRWIIRLVLINTHSHNINGLIIHFSNYQFLLYAVLCVFAVSDQVYFLGHHSQYTVSQNAVTAMRFNCR